MHVRTCALHAGTRRRGPGVWHLSGAQLENIQREIRPSLTPDTRRSTIPLCTTDLVMTRCRARGRTPPARHSRPPQVMPRWVRCVQPEFSAHAGSHRSRARPRPSPIIGRTRLGRLCMQRARRGWPRALHACPRAPGWRRAARGCRHRRRRRRRRVELAGWGLARRPGRCSACAASGGAAAAAARRRRRARRRRAACCYCCSAAAAHSAMALLLPLLLLLLGGGALLLLYIYAAAAAAAARRQRRARRRGAAATAAAAAAAWRRRRARRRRARRRHAAAAEAAAARRRRRCSCSC